jgi:predicted PurR-regulated permease PerM
VLQGIIGLFVGAVVLSVGYTLFTSWLEDTEKEEDTDAADPTASTEFQ